MDRRCLELLEKVIEGLKKMAYGAAGLVALRLALRLLLGGQS
jgi:hypothetical protein